MQRIVATAPLFGYELAAPTGQQNTEPGDFEGRWGFNGVGDDSYEAFLWPPDLIQPPEEDGSVFDSCKTQWRPYDAVVLACLLAAKGELGDDIRIGSDAESPEEWKAGEALYRATFDRDPPLLWPGDAEIE
jgi:hypothetical protein